MNRLSHFLALALLVGAIASFSSCGNGGNTPEQKDDPVLAAACNYVIGGGAATTGGDGGTVFYVSKLDDAIDPQTNQPEVGTLRYACMQGEARTIIFSVAGTIHLNRPLEITRGNLTIAGQSAPGQGICIADYPLIIKNTSNVIVRFIRVRMGAKGSKAAGTDYDAISVNDSRNVVLDHVSASWSTDECVSCYGNTDFTCQYCLISESLRASVHVKGAHGYGGIWGGSNASFHHNLLAHHDSRCPRFDHDYVDATCKGPIDFVNNVVYNWGGNSAYGGEGRSDKGAPRTINFVANYYKPGPATKDGVKKRLLNPTTKCSNCGGTVVPGRFWMENNKLFGADDITADNWKGVHPDESSRLDECKAAARATFVGAISAPQSADEAYETVLARVGCSLVRDAIDERIVREVRDGSSTYKGSNGSTGGLIDDPADVGGWPSLTGQPAKDLDGDGIPDEWEEAHGLNPKSYKDGKEHSLVAAHTNLECYLCDIVKHLY